MFAQLLTPVGNSLGLSFLAAASPVAMVLLLLGVLRRPAWQAALAGLATGLAAAIFLWRRPPRSLSTPWPPALFSRSGR